MEYILDTNICIYIIKKKPNRVFNKFKSLELGKVGISAITLAELQYGIEKSSKPAQNRKALHHFLIPVEIVYFDMDAAITYGSLRKHLEKVGNPIGAMDMLIAAHAQSLNCTLVTNNEKEFDRVVELNVENWVR